MIYLAVIVLVLILYSIFIEPNNIKIKKVSLYFKSLPHIFNGEEIIHISDLHIKKFGNKEKKLLKLIKKLNPNYIVITGDIIDYHSNSLVACKKFFQQLCNFNDKEVFVVFGNHLHANNTINIYNLRKMLNDLGVKVLTNESYQLKKDKNFINIIGVDDPHTGHDNVEKSFENIKSKDFNLVLTHSIELIDKLDPDLVDLLLSGHTHGGQVVFPFIRPFWIPDKYKGKYISGLYKIRSFFAYINPGIATVVLPIRFNASPEITLLKLNKK